MKPTRKSPKTATRHDVGGGEMLTVREIAEMLGTSCGTIRGRLEKGWKGESLVIPVGDRRKDPTPRTQTSVVAYTLALKFKTRLPTVAEIKETYPMSDAAACFWRHTVRAALDRHNNSVKQTGDRYRW